MSIFTRLAAIAAVAATLAAPSVASADSVVSTTGVITAPCSEIRDTDSTYNVRLCGVTDIDQFRSGLAGNGNAHCGPASLYNVMQYIGKQVGAPLQNAFGDLITEYNPHNPAHYWNVTDQLGNLGNTVGWLPTGGTSASANRTAYKAFAANSGWQYDTGGVDTRTTADFGFELAKRLRHAPVQLWYGRYADQPTVTGPQKYRTGGHGITIVSAKGTAGSNEVELTAMDPALAPDHGVGNYLNTQSPATLQTLKLKKVSFLERVIDPETQVITDIRQVTRWQISGPGYDSANGTSKMAEAFSWYYAAPPVG